MNDGYYPEGADTSDAPWNEVTYRISYTLSVMLDETEFEHLSELYFCTSQEALLMPEEDFREFIIEAIQDKHGNLFDDYSGITINIDDIKKY